jgi:hypothetical protein
MVFLSILVILLCLGGCSGAHAADGTTDQSVQGYKNMDQSIHDIKGIILN